MRVFEHEKEKGGLREGSSVLGKKARVCCHVRLSESSRALREEGRVRTIGEQTDAEQTSLLGQGLKLLPLGLRD